MQFDFYAATLPASLSHCKNNIISNFPGLLETEKPVKPYLYGLRHSEKGFRLYHGGCNPLPFFVASGRSAIDGAQFVRTSYPNHRVSRADVAYDFAGPEAFNRIAALLDPIARAARVAVTFIGDPSPNQTAGRSLYYGSPKSDVRLVLYEKGLHELGRGSEKASRDWVRLELRVRPRKERKALTAQMSASAMYGLARWTAKAAEQVVGVVPVYTPDLSIGQSSTEKAFSHMLWQYAKVIRSIIDQNGRVEFDRRITDICNAER